MSSDSEDDCYGNIAQKLQSIKNKYEVDKIKTTNLLDTSQPEASKVIDKVIDITDYCANNACEVLKDDSECEEMSLDAIIAQNTKKKATRRSKPTFDNADISTDNIIPTRGRKRFRASKAIARASIDSDSSHNLSELSVADTINKSAASNVSTVRGRGRGRGRGRKSRKTTNTSITNINNTISTNTTVNNELPSNTITDSSSVSTRSSQRGRNRGRQSNSRRRGQISLPDFLSSMFGFAGSSIPTYSVGNTDEYPDECYNQPLFKTQPPKDDAVVLGENEPELNDSLDENEELSVKVYWQSRECIKFTIRRFQKLQPIFDFFAKRENVTHDKLFFTYNDKILKMDDTPDSITYSIAKFIDGGITNQSVLKIVQKDRATAKNGLKLKFQCQNVKKPYETYIRPEEKLAMAMVRCSEHFEKPLVKLKFLFDGDVISGKDTPKELDLEGGECIDVKIIS